MKTVGGSSSQDSYDRGDNKKLRKSETAFFHGVILLPFNVRQARQRTVPYLVCVAKKWNEEPSQCHLASIAYTVQCHNHRG